MPAKAKPACDMQGDSDDGSEMGNESDADREIEQTQSTQQAQWTEHDPQPYMDINAIFAAIAERPDNAPDLHEQIIATRCKHLSEVYSPPRVALIAQGHGLEPGTAYDATVCDEESRPWNFDYPEHRERATKRRGTEQPALRIGSPRCTPFSA